MLRKQVVLFGGLYLADCTSVPRNYMVVADHALHMLSLFINNAYVIIIHMILVVSDIVIHNAYVIISHMIHCVSCRST